MTKNAATFEWLPVTTLATGSELRLPLHTLKGSKPGPVLGLTAVLHGNEAFPSIGIIRALLDQIDPADLSGTVMAIPVCNPLAFAELSRHTPSDGMNLNSAFVIPQGAEHIEPVKTVSEQIAAVITDGLLRRINYHIDFHSGGASISAHMIEFTADPESTAMARAFNMPILLKDVWMPNQLWAMAEHLGVKSIVAELGGGGLLYDEWVTRGVAGTLNVMRRLGMLPGAVVPPPKQYVVHNTPGHEADMTIYRPKAAGLIMPDPVITGRLAFEGQPLAQVPVLGTLLNPYDLTVQQTFEAPYARTLMLATRVVPTWCVPGEFGYILADADAAEVWEEG